MPSIYQDPQFQEQRRRLRLWFAAYAILWASLFYLMFTLPSPADSAAFIALFWAVLVAYVGAIIYAYQVQRALHLAGLYKHGAWNVVVGGLLLNPYFIGVLIPASVLWAAHRSQKRHAGSEAVHSPRV